MGKWECWLNINLYNLTVVFRFVINFPANGNKWKNIFYPPPSDACMSLSWRLDECCQIYLNISQLYVYDTKQWNDEKKYSLPQWKTVQNHFNHLQWWHQLTTQFSFVQHPSHRLTLAFIYFNKFVIILYSPHRHWIETYCTEAGETKVDKIASEFHFKRCFYFLLIFLKVSLLFFSWMFIYSSFIRLTFIHAWNSLKFHHRLMALCFHIFFIVRSDIFSRSFQFIVHTHTGWCCWESSKCLRFLIVPQVSFQKMKRSFTRWWWQCMLVMRDVEGREHDSTNMKFRNSTYSTDRNLWSFGSLFFAFNFSLFSPLSTCPGDGIGFQFLFSRNFFLIFVCAKKFCLSCLCMFALCIFLHSRSFFIS